MWNYTCMLCGDKESDDYLCEKCRELKKIVDLYNIDVVNTSLKRIFVRDTEPILNRTDKEKSEVTTRSKTKLKVKEDKEV